MPGPSCKVAMLMCVAFAPPAKAAEHPPAAFDAPDEKAPPAPSVAAAAPANQHTWPDLSDLPRTLEHAGAPQGALPPAPPKGTARAISLTGTAGPGWLALRDDLGRDGQKASGFAVRLGLVVAPEWTLTTGVDRTSARRGEATFSQTALLMGLQPHFGRLYLGGALGVAWVRETGVPDGLTDGPGVSLSGTLGIEAVRTRHAALTAEVTMTVGKYERESWEMGGVRLGVVVF